MTIRRARLFAFFLDLLVCAAAADAAALAASAGVWFLAPGWRTAVPWIWAAGAPLAAAAFLLRDARGGRARRWLALEARDRDGRPPGAWGSVRRNLPLLVPIWNLFEVWPLLRDGEAERPSDRRRGIRILRTE